MTPDFDRALTAFLTSRGFTLLRRSSNNRSYSKDSRVDSRVKVKVLVTGGRVIVSVGFVGGLSGAFTVVSYPSVHADGNGPAAYREIVGLVRRAAVEASGWIRDGKAPPAVPEVEWISQKNAFGRLEAEQEARAFMSDPDMKDYASMIED